MPTLQIRCQYHSTVACDDMCLPGPGATGYTSAIDHPHFQNMSCGLERNLYLSCVSVRTVLTSIRLPVSCCELAERAAGCANDCLQQYDTVNCLHEEVARHQACWQSQLLCLCCCDNRNRHCKRSCLPPYVECELVVASRSSPIMPLPHVVLLSLSTC